MFIPLMKADAAQRRVYGYIDETPDRAGEILDYVTAKPAFEEWSKTFSDATGGKSLGNIRAQHDMKKAAGKLVELVFDDLSKRISFCAEIVDDQEWAKVEAGVYTGFSPGGSYAKRWPDGLHKRYTPKVGELSIVDMPCIPSGTFTMIKADGAEQQVEFVLAQAYEPGNDATKNRAAEMAKAAGKDGLAKDFVVQARADLIAENAAEALAKMVEPEAQVADQESPVDPTAALEKSLANAAAVIAAAAAPAAAPGPFADLTKVAGALTLLSAEPLAKSLWSADWLNQLLREFAALQAEVTWDAKYSDPGNEADMSIPAQAAKIVKAIGDLLITMTQEGVADILAGIESNGIEIVILEGDDMALAASIVDLVKADADLMEKAGKRNNKTDAKTIQSMHDGAVSLGATCDSASEKAATLGAENERLAKAIGEAAPRIDAMAKTIETLTLEKSEIAGQLENLLAEPRPPKGPAFELSKTADASREEEPKEPANFMEKLAATPPGPKRAQLLLNHR